MRSFWLRKLAYLAIAGSIFFRFQSIFQRNPLYALWSDPGRHWSSALKSATDDPLLATDPLGFQVWLTAIAKITNADPKAIAVYAGILSCITPWFWYKFLRELLISKDLALLGWVILAWLPSWIGIYSFFMTETLLLPLFGASLWFTWRSARRRTPESFVWAACFWIAAILTKATILPAALVSMSWLWLIHENKIKKCALVTLMLFCALFPPAYRTYKVIGVWAPLGYPKFGQILFASGAETIYLNLLYKGETYRYLFASESLYNKPFKPFTTWPNFRTGAFHVTIDISKGARDWDRALKDYTGGMGLRTRNAFENIIYSLWSPSWPNGFDNVFWDRMSNDMRWLWAPLFVVVSVLNLLWLKRYKTFHAMPIIHLLSWFLMFTLPLQIGSGRYRKPFEGLLIANVLWLIESYFTRTPAELQQP